MNGTPLTACAILAAAPAAGRLCTRGGVRARCVDPGREARERRRRRRRQRGVALILVLASITILTVMLTEFQSETSAELGSATAERDAVKAEYAARSGLNLARLLISAEPTIRNRLLSHPLFGVVAAFTGGKMPQLPVWKFADQVLGAFNDKAGQEAFQGLAGVNLDEGKNLGIEGASFEVKVVDEGSKINVNLPARGGSFYNADAARQLMALMLSPQYDPMFEQRDPDGQFSDRFTICSALIDWADPDEDTYPCDPTNLTAQKSVAEDSFYQMLKSPYQRKNAAYDSLEELHMVRGVSDDFWATFVEPDPDDPDTRVLTVWGQDQINVNTAPPQVLLAMACANAVIDPPQVPCVGPDLAPQLMFIGVIRLLQGMLSGMPLFTSAGAFVQFVQGKGPFAQTLFAPDMGFGLVPIQLQSEKFLKEKLGVESKIFSIYATGRVKAGKRESVTRIHAVVDYRKAPPPSAPRDLDDMASAVMTGAGLGTTVMPSQDAELPEGADPENALSQYFAPNPAGHIIYYRVD